MHALTNLYHQHAKTVRFIGGWLGYGMVTAAAVLETVPEIGAPQQVVALLLWLGSWLAGSVFLKQAETQVGRWLAGGGGLALAAGGQYLLAAYPDAQYIRITALLMTGVGGISKGLMVHRPNVARASSAAPAPEAP